VPICPDLFPIGLDPGGIGWQTRAITVTRDRVGMQVWSGNTGNQMEWVELDLSGNVTGRWRLNDVVQTGAVAFTSDDQVYIPHSDSATKDYQVLKLNHVTSTWEKVQSPGLRLYGSDGDQLIFAEWGRGDGLMHLSWFKQPELH